MKKRLHSKGWRLIIDRIFYQISLGMKITVLFLMASTFLMGYSNTGFGQEEITIQVNNGTVSDVIDELETSTSYAFVYRVDAVDLKRRVSIRVEKSDIVSILHLLFDNTETQYHIRENQIILTPRVREVNKINILPPRISHYLRKTVHFNQTVSGTVTDSKGEALIGVNVLVDGSTKGTATDLDGRFALEDVNENATLIFSYVGYQTQKVSLEGRSTLSITMPEDLQTLEEVVVVGYGITQKKIDLTGAVDVVSVDALSNRPAPKISDLLMGVSPNLTISHNGRAGEPGAATSWNLRGLGTISGSSSPLILIDGVEGNPDNLDPQSIKSVTILKDASAASIYGSRAAFGVVLITTKKGEKGKVQLRYDVNFDWSNPIHVSDMYPSNIWATAFNDMQVNSGLPPAYPEEQMQRINGYLTGTYKTEYDPENPPRSIFTGRYVGNANWNWPEIFLQNTALSQDHTVSLSGGEGNTQFFVSGGYYNQQGIYRWGDDSYKRYNLIANVTSQATDWIKFNYGVRYAQSNTDYPLGVAGRRDRGRDIRMIYQFSPMTPWYNVNGTVGNPIIRSMQSSGRDKTQNNDLWLRLGSELEPVKGWKTNINYHYNLQASDNTEDQIPVWIETPIGSLFNWGYRNPGALNRKTSRNYYTLNATTSYEKEIDKHFAKLLFGFEQELDQYKSLFGRRTGLISVTVPSINAATGDIELEAGSGHWATRAGFGRLNYDFDNKFLFQITGRLDGSSRFPEGNRWSFFPSASVGYNIAREKFWQPLLPYVNFLKLRVSYGSLGNQSVPNYLYLPTISVQPQLDRWIVNGERPAYARAPRIISGDLTWETVTSMNLGLDARALDDRLGFSFSWFNRETSDMFGPTEDLPAVLGTSAPRENNASLETKGFELTIDWRDNITNELFYNVKLNLGDYTTRITKYRNPNNLIDDWYVGKRFGEVWGYETMGLIQSQEEAEGMADQSEFYDTWGPGDIRYADLNGDGVLNDGTRTMDDFGDLKIIGNDQPRFNVGIFGGVQWKGFGFNMFWEGVMKRDFYPNNQSIFFWGLVGGGNPGSESAVLKGSPVLDYWRPANETNILGPNTDAWLPKPYADKGSRRKNQITQSRYLLDAAYLRLRNVQLSYTVPSHLTERITFNSIRVYFSASNVLTITDIPESLDPETMWESADAPNAVYPLTRRLTCGLNITF